MIRAAFRTANRAGGQPSGTGWAWPGRLFLLLVLIATVAHWPRFFAVALAVTVVFVVPAVLVTGGRNLERRRLADRRALDDIMRGLERRS